MVCVIVFVTVNVGVFALKISATSPDSLFEVAAVKETFTGVCLPSAQ
jgi:hypothetical protein